MAALVREMLRAASPLGMPREVAASPPVKLPMTADDPPAEAV